jgi:hypothetical protein
MRLAQALRPGVGTDALFGQLDRILILRLEVQGNGCVIHGQSWS